MEQIEYTHTHIYIYTYVTHLALLLLVGEDDGVVRLVLPPLRLLVPRPELLRARDLVGGGWYRGWVWWVV